jgi:hypothetical protein
MTKDDLLHIFQRQLEQYRTKTNKVVMMLIDPEGSRIHVADADKLDDLAALLANYAYDVSETNSIPRFTHFNSLNHDSE